MSIFGNIASAIFGHGSAAATKAAVGSAAAPSAPAAKAAPPAGGAPATSATAGSAAAPGAAVAKGGPPAGGAPASGKLLTRDQVEETIKKIADAQNEDYNWKQSIVDLMKLLKLDSSLTARKQLAQELGYKGELTGSAENEHLAARTGHAKAC